MRVKKKRVFKEEGNDFTAYHEVIITVRQRPDGSWYLQYEKLTTKYPAHGLPTTDYSAVEYKIDEPADPDELIERHFSALKYAGLRAID